MISITQTIGERVKEARTKRGLTQKLLAKLISRSVRTLQLYENNQMMPAADVLGEIAEQVGTSVDYLLTGNEYTDLSNATHVLGDDDDEPVSYEYSGRSVYIPTFSYLPDDSEIEDYEYFDEDLILVERSKLKGKFKDHFAICVNIYFDSFHKRSKEDKTTFIIQWQAAVKSGDLAYLQFEGIPMIGKIFFGKNITSILTDSDAPERLQIPPDQIEDLIIFGKVIFTIQEY